jgi:hypothetical protein
MVRIALALMATTVAAFAAFDAPVPEIDAQMGTSAITVLAGGLLLLRSRRKVRK